MHSRTETRVEIPLAHIRLDRTSNTNDYFVKTIIQFEKGKTKCALTRIPIKAITPGFYEHSGGKVVYISNSKGENVTSFQRMIRRGSRPIVDLYWSPLAPDGGSYVCPDDESLLAAYKMLNFALIPCRVLRPKKVDATEGSIWVEKRGGYISLAKAVAPTQDFYASLVGNRMPLFPNLTPLLIEKCSDARKAIVAFHEDEGSNVHYHQMLHAILRRHERVLHSIANLIALGRAEHAAILVRVAYEAFLNFYIDWLSPEFFGSRFQLLAAIREAEGQGVRSLSSSLDVLDNFTSFLENTSDKARVSPLGSFFHASVYPSLSLIAHQSYAYLEREASDFRSADEPDPTSVVEQIGRWLDVLTAALLVRISNEIGRT